MLVPEWMLTGARSGSNEAKSRLREYCAGASLTKGVKGYDEDLVVVNLRELCQLGAVAVLTIEGAT
jgi:hypothetical protein